MLKDKHNPNLSHHFLSSPVITKNGGEVISKDSHSDCRLDQPGGLYYIFFYVLTGKRLFSGLNLFKKIPQNAIFVECVRIFLVLLSMPSISHHK